MAASWRHAAAAARHNAKINIVAAALSMAKWRWRQRSVEAAAINKAKISNMRAGKYQA